MVIDVLSFTTTLSVSLDAGIAVLPCRWDDADAPARFVLALESQAAVCLATCLRYTASVVAWTCSQDSPGTATVSLVAAGERRPRQEQSAPLSCASGRELVDRGYGVDVEIAAEVDAGHVVPQLIDLRRTNAQSRPAPPGAQRVGLRMTGPEFGHPPSERRR